MLIVFLTSLRQMSTLLVLLCVGYILARRGTLRDAAVADIIHILVKVLIPVLLFNALQTSYSPVLLRRGGLMFLAAFGMMGLSALLTLGTMRPLRVPARIRGDWVFGAVLSNVGFIGLPVIAALFHDETASFLATGVIVASNLVFGSIGGQIIRHFSPGGARGSRNLRGVLLNPAIVGFLAGMLCFCLGIRMPEIIAAPLNMLAGMTAPLSMITVGALLTKCKFRDMMCDRHLYALCAIRLLIVPLIMWGVLRFFTQDPMTLTVGAIMFGMPAAAVMPGISLNNGGDPVWATEYTLLSTLFSAVTIPFLHMLSAI